MKVGRLVKGVIAHDHHLTPDYSSWVQPTRSAHLSVALSVGGPQHDDLVDAGGGLELANLTPHGLHLLHLGALDEIVGALLLVGRNEILVVDARQRLQVLHVWHQLPLQLKVQHLRACW